jgi:(4S)-4-hydroxy-5-phosphonooxypentane-2,3-dione isomerase
MPISDQLLVVHVQVRVKPEAVEPFLRLTVENAEKSLREPGVVRFDLCQEAGDPTRFVLVEAYRGQAGAAAHKETAHYQAWRDAVAPLMAEPRSSRKFLSLFPEPKRW